ncbi:energy transducer TonB [Celeribacter marinus]|uniref:energy transducer TonB n=1 Tax=Celeribacter marinus TaxID=1397108 RepID=UPI003F6C7A5F
MTSGLRFAAFISLSLAAHIAFAGFAPMTGGDESAGEEGTAILSITASSASLAAMVETWDAARDTPPDVFVDTSAPEAPSEDMSALPASASPLHLAPPKLSGAALNMPSESAQAAPSADQPPAPLAPPKPKAKPKSAAKAAPNSSKASSASAAQRAAGQGGGQARGAASKAQVATVSAGQARKDLANWGASIRAAIERKKRSPSGAGKSTGTVGVRLTVSPSGSLGSVAVYASSGSSSLDQAAIAAVQRAGRFKRAPASLTKSSYSFKLKIAFSSR